MNIGFNLPFYLDIIDSYLIANTAIYFVPEYLRPSISIPIIIFAMRDPALNIMCNGIGMSKFNAQLFTTLTAKYMITIC